MAKCEDIVGKKLTALTDSEIKEITSELRKLKEIRGANDSAERAEARMEKALNEMLDDIEKAKIQRRRQFFQNLLIERKALEIMDQADKATGNPFKGIMAILGGLNNPFDGSLRSIDSVSQGIYKSVAGGMLAELDAKGLTNSVRHMKGDLEKQVSRAMAELNGAENVGFYSSEAKQIAQIFHKTQDHMRRRKNKKGAFIGRKQGYVVRQSHNVENMIRKGKETWIKTIRGRLDYEKMGIPETDIDRFLDSAWIAIKSGVRKQKKADGQLEEDTTLDVFDSMFKYSGPGNLAKRLSEHRLLEFKSPDDWYEYNKVFGSGQVLDSVFSEIHSGARDIAMMDALGTNPKAMLDRLMEKGRLKYREQGKEKLFSDSAMNNLYMEISGMIDIPETPAVGPTNLALIGRGARAIQSMAKLGVAFISAWADNASMLASRHYQGNSLMQSFVDSVFAPLKGMAPTDAKKYAKELGFGIDGLLGHFTSRFSGGGDQPPGTSSFGMNTFFKLNLLQGWTDSAKTGIGMALNRDFARDRSLKFKQLDPNRQRLFKIYDINEDEWDLIRKATRQINGAMHISPSKIKVPKSGKYAKMSDLARENYRDKVVDSLNALFLNEQDVAVPTPGARERALLRWGMRPGTWRAEGMRTFMQFKSFPVTVITKVMQRQTQGYGARGVFDSQFYTSRGMVGLATFIGYSTMLGLLSLQAKQIVKGRKPREINPQTMLAAALQGGGLGFYGDFLFAEYSRTGGGLADSVAGPGFGELFGLFETFNKYTHGAARGDVDIGDLPADLAKIIKNNIPGQNIFYVKAALDYLILHGVQEMINPGYLSRHEQFLRRQYNQEYIIPPSEQRFSLF